MNKKNFFGLFILLYINPGLLSKEVTSKRKECHVSPNYQNLLKNLDSKNTDFINKVKHGDYVSKLKIYLSEFCGKTKKLITKGKHTIGKTERLLRRMNDRKKNDYILPIFRRLINHNEKTTEVTDKIRNGKKKNNKDISPVFRLLMDEEPTDENKNDGTNNNSIKNESISTPNQLSINQNKNITDNPLNVEVDPKNRYLDPDDSEVIIVKDIRSKRSLHSSEEDNDSDENDQDDDEKEVTLLKGYAALKNLLKNFCIYFDNTIVEMVDNNHLIVKY